MKSKPMSRKLEDAVRRNIREIEQSHKNRDRQTDTAYSIFLIVISFVGLVITYMVLKGI